MKTRHRIESTLLAVLLVAFACGSAAARDPLPSWNDGPTKQAILEFVAAVTAEKGNDYVEPAERIAVFDNDGTLWIEYPMYTQALFAFDRVKQLAPQHPEWKARQPFKGGLEISGIAVRRPAVIVLGVPGRSPQVVLYEPEFLGRAVHGR